MQPAEEVHVDYIQQPMWLETDSPYVIDFATMFLFRYCRRSKVALEEQTQRDFGHNLCGKYDFVSGYFSDIKKSILLQPYIKGTLIQFDSKTEWKIRTEKLYTSKELFTLRFDRNKVKGDLKEWLYSRMRDIYEKSDCDDPRINPLTDDKRKEVWHEAALLFRTYNKRATHINHLPVSIDPATLPMIKPDTVNNNILQIMTLYDGPGSIRLRS